jgi:hypothetical protein
MHVSYIMAKSAFEAETMDLALTGKASVMRCCDRVIRADTPRDIMVILAIFCPTAGGSFYGVEVAVICYLGKATGDGIMTHETRIVSAQ